MKKKTKKKIFNYIKINTQQSPEYVFIFNMNVIGGL